MTNYRIVEIFSSINGEGPRAGELAIFIRMQGCNLDCSYCDTSWANEEDARFRYTPTDEIIDLVRLMNVRNVTITGGEPLVQENILELLTALSMESGIRVEIETNGTVDLRPFAEMDNPPCFTMDYKLPGSGMENRMLPENFQYLKPEDSVKFVVKDYEDLLRARDVIQEYELTGKCHLYLSPAYGDIEPEDIVNFMKSNNMNDVRLQLQLHKIIWDSEMRGV